MQIVPLADVPSQSVSVQLNAQNVQIVLHTELTGLYADIYLNGSTTPLLAGVLCENVNRLVRDAYLGLIGDFTFYDSQAGVRGQDPSYPGLGSRYLLLYLEPADLPT